MRTAESFLWTWDAKHLHDIALTHAPGCRATLSADRHDGVSLVVGLEPPAPAGGPDALTLRFSSPLRLTPGRSHEVALTCRASHAGPAELLMPDGGRHRFRIQPYPLTVKVIFTAANDSAQVVLRLGSYDKAAQVSIGPVSLREIPLMPRLAAEWTVFPKADAAAAVDRVPQELSGPEGNVRARPQALTDQAIDLARLAGGHREKACAVLFNEFDSPADGWGRAGFSADYWMDLYVNGERCYDTLVPGNVSIAYRPEDHVVEFPVRAGRNLLAAKVFSGSSGWRFVCGSPAVSPGLTILPPAGKVMAGRFASRRIYPGMSYAYWVYVPSQHDPARPACVYVSHDGHDYPGFVKHLDLLIAQNEIPALVGIFVEPGEIQQRVGRGGIRSNRGFEYNSLGDRYARFLLEEMLPHVERECGLKLSRNGNDRAIGGCSSGGISALNAAWERPGAFSRVYSNCGSFVAYAGGETFPVLLRKCEPRPLRIYLHGATRDIDNSGGHFWLTHQSMKSALAFSGYEFKTSWSRGPHIDKYWEIFPAAMRYLWRGHPAPVKASPGSGEMREFLLPGEGWTKVPLSCRRPQCLATNARGELFIGEADRIFKLDGQGVLTLFAAGTGAGALAFDASGRLLALSKPRQQLLAFDAGGRAEPVASGIRGGSLCPVDGLGVYCGSGGQVRRIKPDGQAVVADSGLKRAAGCALSADGSRLYAVDGGARWIYTYILQPDGALANKEATLPLPVRDGDDHSHAGPLCVAAGGHLLAATALGIYCGSDQPYGNQLLANPGTGPVTGLCFGGAEFDTLYAISGRALWRRKLKIKGLRPGTGR